MGEGEREGWGLEWDGTSEKMWVKVGRESGRREGGGRKMKGRDDSKGPFAVVVFASVPLFRLSVAKFLVFSDWRCL